MYKLLLYIKILIVLHTTATVRASELCEGNKCLHKCCPTGHFYGRSRSCEAGHDELNFSDVDVYDKDMSKTGKSLKDTFHLLAGKFEEDLDFTESAVDVSLVFNVYVSEDGDLLTEVPNTYDRWTRHPNGDFCVEYRMSKKGLMFPHFWTTVNRDDVPDIPESNKYMSYATLLSCVFLLLVLIVYALLPELRNLCGLILMAYDLSLFWAFLLLAIIQLNSYITEVCITLTLLIYFSFLSSFCWMSVMSYDIWWTFRGYAKARPIHRRGEKFKFLMYGLFAWGMPLMMTIALGVLNTTGMPHLPWFITPQVPKMGCFLEGGVKFVYLYIPMLILIIANWLFYSMTAFNVWRLSRGTAVLANSAARGTPSAHRTQRHRFLVYLKLSIVMGLNWLFEVASFLWPEFKGWYITDMYNILIGLAIFLIFVCKPKIFKKLEKRLNLRNMQWHPSSKSYSSSTSDTNQETVTMQICSNPRGTA